eukprot:5800309-Amphidinium_carterae.1
MYRSYAWKQTADKREKQLSKRPRLGECMLEQVINRLTPVVIVAPWEPLCHSMPKYKASCFLRAPHARAR